MIAHPGALVAIVNEAVPLDNAGFDGTVATEGLLLVRVTPLGGAASALLRATLAGAFAPTGNKPAGTVNVRDVVVDAGYMTT